MDMELIKKVNKEFKIVFQPKDHSLGCVIKRRRFAVGAGSLTKYISEELAVKTMLKALDSPEDSIKFQFRKQGQVTYYSK